MKLKDKIANLEQRIAGNDDHYSMAISYVKDIQDMTAMLEKILMAGLDLEDWVNAKITRARTDLVDVTKYLQNYPKKASVKNAAEYQGKEVELDKPFRTTGGPKKFSVYVKNDKGNVVKVNFGDPNMEIRRDNDEARKSFRARHQCDVDPGPKWKAKYWSCRMWEKGFSVSDVLKGAKVRPCPETDPEKYPGNDVRCKKIEEGKSPEKAMAETIGIFKNK